MSWKDDKKRIRKNRQKLIKYKKTLSCKACGLDDYRVLEFHHLCDKEECISRMVGVGYGWKTIMKEIDKCVALCSNCHRIEHWTEAESA
tara:strand:- start:999 stop:1265 length:267 start_codon:yes stop_codon:yes gene_type:complete